VETGPAWLAGIPVDRPYVLSAAVAVLLAAGLRIWGGRTRPGRGLLRVLHGCESGVVALFLASMLLLSFLQILLRNFAQTGFVWIDPLLRHLLLWIGFTGATLATRLGRHIHIDILSRLLPARGLRLAHAATNLLGAALCLLLSNACLKLVREEAAAGTTSFLELPTWVLQSVMPVTLLVMSYRFVRHAFDAARGQEPAWTLPLELHR